MEDNNEFKLVENRKSRKTTKHRQNANDDVDELYKRVEDIKCKLKSFDDAKFWDRFCFDFRKCVDSCLNEKKSDIKLICFGLGSPDENLNSRYQLAFMLLLIDLIHSTFRPQSTPIELFDPVFNEVDTKLLTIKYKFKLCDANTRCMHRVTAEQPMTIFFMPHCGKSLYNNLLYSNWSVDCLSRLMIIGNDFETIDQLTPSDKMLKHYSYVRDSLMLMQKRKLNGSECSLTNAFQDLCIQYFDLNKTDLKTNFDQLKNQLANNENQLDKLEAPLIEPGDNEII